MRNEIAWSIRLDIQNGHIKSNMHLVDAQVQTIYPFRYILENSAFSRLKMVYPDYIINVRKYPCGEYPITFELWHKSR